MAYYMLYGYSCKLCMEILSNFYNIQIYITKKKNAILVEKIKERNWSNGCLKFKGASDRCGDRRKTDEKHIKDI